MYFFLTIGAYILILVGKKIYYYVRYKKRFYIFPKINSSGIANTSMVISISVSIIFILTSLTAGLMGIFFRIYPGWRVTIEGILINIGGLLFGPIIGIFIGAATDLLTIMLTAGMFHYGFFVCSIAFGFFSGLIKSLINVSKKNDLVYVIGSTVIIVIIAIAVDLYLYYFPEKFILSMFGKEITFPVWSLWILIDVPLVVAVALIWLFWMLIKVSNIKLSFLRIKYYFVISRKENYFRRKFIKKKNLEKYSKKELTWMTQINGKYQKILQRQEELIASVVNSPKEKVNNMTQVLLLLSLTQPIVCVVMMPYFDASLGGGMPVSFWITFRALSVLPLMVINFAVIFPVYNVIRPIIQYDYRSNIIESARTPVPN